MIDPDGEDRDDQSSDANGVAASKISPVQVGAQCEESRVDCDDDNICFTNRCPCWSSKNSVAWETIFGWRVHGENVVLRRQTESQVEFQIMHFSNPCATGSGQIKLDHPGHLPNQYL